MEFEGRILRVLPAKSGTSAKGEWKTLPFVFEYFEKAEQRWSDKILLETFDQGIMGQIGRFVQRGPDGKGIYENGSARLTGEIKCRIGFYHNVKNGKRQDGTEFTMNEIRMYKFELLPTGNDVGTAAGMVDGTAGVTQARNAAGMAAPPYSQLHQDPFPPQQPAQENDDLPF